jgi:hypothetical protein
MAERVKITCETAAHFLYKFAKLETFSEQVGQPVPARNFASLQLTGSKPDSNIRY